jgi:hypothetical protein
VAITVHIRTLDLAIIAQLALGRRGVLGHQLTIHHPAEEGVSKAIEPVLGALDAGDSEGELCKGLVLAVLDLVLAEEDVLEKGDSQRGTATSADVGGRTRHSAVRPGSVHRNPLL